MLIERTREVTTLTGNPTSEVIAAITAQLLGLGSNIDEPYVTKFFLDTGKIFEFQPELYDSQGGVDAEQKAVMWVLYGREHLSTHRFFKLNVYYHEVATIEIITLDFHNGDEEHLYLKPTDLEWSI